MNSEPLWCEVRQHYCRCHDYGKRCVEEEAEAFRDDYLGDLTDGGRASSAANRSEGKT